MTPAELQKLQRDQIEFDIMNHTIKFITVIEVRRSFADQCSADACRLQEKVIPTVCQLLGSSTNSDVLDAVSFFKTAFQFQVDGALKGVRKMVVLVWNKEQTIRERCSVQP